MSKSSHAASITPKRRFFTFAMGSGIITSILLSLTLTGTLSGFTASITNNNDTAGSGTLVMQEQNAGATSTCLSTDAGTISTNASTCSSINKFGGQTNMLPGGAFVDTPITIKNLGTATPTTFTLTAGPTCTQTNNGALNGTAVDACTKYNVIIKSGATTVFTGTAATLAATASATFVMPAPPAPGVSVPFTVSVQLDASAGNTYQGLAVSVPLKWTFAS